MQHDTLKEHMAITIEEVIHQQVGNTVCVGTIIRLKDCIHIKVHTGLFRDVNEGVGYDTWSGARTVRNVCLPAVLSSVRDIFNQSL